MTRYRKTLGNHPYHKGRHKLAINASNWRPPGLTEQDNLLNPDKTLRSGLNGIVSKVCHNHSKCKPVKPAVRYDPLNWIEPVNPDETVRLSSHRVKTKVTQGGWPQWVMVVLVLVLGILAGVKAEKNKETGKKVQIKIYRKWV